MRCVARPDQLAVTAGEPCCYIDAHFGLWLAGGRLGGYSVWGTPSAVDTRAFIAALGWIASKREHRPLLVVGDFREIETIDGVSFQLLCDYLADHAGVIASTPFREAVLHGDGPVGATIAGFYSVAPRLGSIGLFRDVAHAAAWLDRRDVRDLLDDFAEARAVRSANKTVVALNSLLREDPSIDRLEAAAKRLGMSGRTLQRRLRHRGSSFRLELAHARLCLAQSLLRRGDKITAVAVAVGFASQQHFSTWFKRRVGVSPSTWRTSAGPKTAR